VVRGGIYYIVVVKKGQSYRTSNNIRTRLKYRSYNRQKSISSTCPVFVNISDYGSA
jgi:hypothetical protein